MENIFNHIMYMCVLYHNWIHIFLIFYTRVDQKGLTSSLVTIILSVLLKFFMDVKKKKKKKKWNVINKQGKFCLITLLQCLSKVVGTLTQKYCINLTV